MKAISIDAKVLGANVGVSAVLWSSGTGAVEAGIVERAGVGIITAKGCVAAISVAIAKIKGAGVVVVTISGHGITFAKMIAKIIGARVQIIA